MCKRIHKDSKYLNIPPEDGRNRPKQRRALGMTSEEENAGGRGANTSEDGAGAGARASGMTSEEGGDSGKGRGCCSGR